MSEVVKLPEIALASDVAATDKLLRTDGKAVSVGNVVSAGAVSNVPGVAYTANPTPDTWYRIATAAIMGGTLLLTIHKDWGTGGSCMTTVSVVLPHGNQSLTERFYPVVVNSGGFGEKVSLRLVRSTVGVKHYSLDMKYSSGSNIQVGVAVNQIVGGTVNKAFTIAPALLDSDEVNEWTVAELAAENLSQDFTSVPSVTDAASFSFLGMVGGAVKTLGAANVLARKTARTDLNVFETGLYSVHLTEATPPFSSGVWLTLLVISMAVTPSPVALQIAVNSSKYGGLYIRSYSESASGTTPFYLIQGTAQ